jgi:hypothetical protein
LILARIVRSFREHDWFTAVVELALLIVGIFAGFQLDRWNDGRLDQQRADGYREQLITDLSVERNDVEGLIAYYEQVRSFALTALNAWNDPPPEDAQKLIFALYQASNVLPIASVRGAYDALSTNGLLDRLGSPAFTSKLSAYYGQELNAVLNEVKRYRMELRGIMPIAVQEQIRTECIRLSLDERITEALSVDCDLGLEEAEAQHILAEIVAHPEMRAYLRQGISRDSVSIELLNSKQEFIESLIVELRSHVE